MKVLVSSYKKPSANYLETQIGEARLTEPAPTLERSKMREQIAEIIKKEESHFDNIGWACADKILVLMRKEIKKVGKPRGCRAYSALYSDGFEECRQAILKALEAE